MICENSGDFKLYNEIIERFLGGFKTYTSADSIFSDDPQHASYCPLQFLNVRTHTIMNVVNSIFSGYDAVSLGNRKY
jgi:hypothetical protein